MGPTALLPLRRKACWGFFRPEKSDGFGRVWTRELGYQRPDLYLYLLPVNNCNLYSDVSLQLSVNSRDSHSCPVKDNFWSTDSTEHHYMQREDVCVGALVKGITKNILLPSSGLWIKAYVTRRDIRYGGEERRYEIIRRGRILFRELEGAGTAELSFIRVAIWGVVVSNCNWRYVMVSPSDVS